MRAAIAAELAAGAVALTRPMSLGGEQLRCLTEAIAGLDPASPLVPFDDGAIDAALKRGQRSRGALHVWQIQPALFVWSPVPEQRLLVISGQAGARGAISVLRLAKDGAVEHLASALIEEQEPGIALGSSEQYPRNLLWTTCYECPGAGGNIRFEDDASVSFLYR
jgi:hypothetical protein